MVDKIVTGADVTLETIHLLRDKLKAHSTKWCADMAERMFGITAKTPFKYRERAKGRVNNIVFGNTCNPEMRAAFMIKGAELLREYEARQSALGAALETAKSA